MRRSVLLLLTTVNVLVTGGAGYLGCCLVRLLLESGHHVRVLDSLLHGGEPLLGFWHKPQFEFVFGDIRDLPTLRASLDQIDSVVHLAAIVGDPACARDPIHAREVNLDASLALLQECCKRQIEKFVFASTCSNYGRMPGAEEYVDEQSPLSPLSVYAETKVAFEEALLTGNDNSRPAVTSLRLATLYGVSPRMRFDLTVNEFTFDMLCKGHLVVFGEQFWRPYIHVRDAARAFCEILQAPASQEPEVYNVGATDQNFRKSDLIEFIRPYAPNATIDVVRKAGDLRDYRVCFDKIAKRLGFRPAYSVQQGIAEVAKLVRSRVIENPAGSRFRN